MVDYTQYVADLYRNELGRSGDQADIDAWVNAIASGGLSQQQVADMIERSPEGVNYDVNRLYQTELGRAPDAEGAKSWGDALSSGNLSDEEMLNRIRLSQEYAQPAIDQYGGLLGDTYRREVGRDPDAGGLAQWAAALRSGGVKESDLGNLFSNTSEGYVFDLYNSVS